MEVTLGAGEANDASPCCATRCHLRCFAGVARALWRSRGRAIPGRRAPSTAQTMLTDRNLLLTVHYRELKNFADKRLPITFQEPIVAGEGGGKKLFSINSISRHITFETSFSAILRLKHYSLDRLSSCDICCAVRSLPPSLNRLLA